MESIGSSLGIDWELIWAGLDWSGPDIRPCLYNRIIVSALVPVPFLWTLGPGFETWILDLQLRTWTWIVAQEHVGHFLDNRSSVMVYLLINKIVATGYKQKYLSNRIYRRDIFNPTVGTFILGNQCVIPIKIFLHDLFCSCSWTHAWFLENIIVWQTILK